MLTVAEIVAAIEQLSVKEQQEISQAVLNLPINIQGDREIDASDFWGKVERFRALVREENIDVAEIWGDVRDRSSINY